MKTQPQIKEFFLIIKSTINHFYRKPLSWGKDTALANSDLITFSDQIQPEWIRLVLKSENVHLKSLISLHVLNHRARFSSQISALQKATSNLPYGKTRHRRCRHDDSAHRRSQCRCDEVRSTPAAHCQDSCGRNEWMQINMEKKK